MIDLFNINNHIIDTNEFDNLLHDKCVVEFEEKFAHFVGAKYACSVSSASNAIFLTFVGLDPHPQGDKITVDIPSIIPHVVPNTIITAGCRVHFTDDINWVGDSYTLHQFSNYKVIDSAQRVKPNQFKNEADDDDVMIFSFYPTKPVGGCDGGMIVSNNADIIKFYKEMSFYGMSYAQNNWERRLITPGYKMYMNSIQAYIANKNFNNYKSKISKLNKLRNQYNSEFEYNNISDHLYRISVDDNTKFIDYMKLHGIVCGIHYTCQHTNPVYKQYSDSSNCPDSEKISAHTASIPFHEKLDSFDIERIIKCVKSYGIYKDN